jgi:hypothetical protein
VNHNGPCAFPGQPVPPHAGLFYTSHGYSCLNAGRYYDLILAPLNELGHVLLVAIVAGAGGLLVASAALALAGPRSPFPPVSRAWMQVCRRLTAPGSGGGQ